MKSFSQFLQESYLSEEIPGNISRDEFNKLPARSKRNLTGGSDLGLGLQDQPLQKPKFPNYGGSSRPAVRSARTRSNASPESWEHRNPGKLPIPNPPSRPQGTTTTVPSSSVTGQSAPTPSTTPTGGSGGTGGKPPSGPKLKVPSGLGKVARVAGRIAGPVAAALDVADERSKGSGWVRSLAKGAAVAAGGALGGAAGSVVGPVGTVAGATGGSMAASKAFDVAAGANAAQRKSMATANRQAQSGGSLKGIGGKTTFDTKKNTITTGSGSQQKTVKLGKTSVVTGPGGKQDVGYLAYKGGKAVYKRADTKNLAQTSSNPLERIGRSLFAGAYKKSDAAAAAKKLSAARQSDVARNKALGVKALPGK